MKQKIDKVLNPSIADYNSLLTPEEIIISRNCHYK